MSHSNTDAFIIGILLFIAGAAFMAICHSMVLVTRYFLEKLDKPKN